ncbi:hypothetical protein [Polyangium spumosum]|uniref:Uncharacterized protein n=1 Tax=Polyangium spumosum TaxID=889282 RepID=A0A6N7PYP4_9BACT|nr:hypothetical protein [Polyangium spumosum]MRG93851.1 hypothetical protein [Polyangium spumosum]
MKREKRLTKRERKALAPPRPAAAPAHVHHIHCIACGRHLEPEEMQTGEALMLRCQHGSTFPSCSGCRSRSIELLAEHDRTGQAVRTASAWH